MVGSFVTLCNASTPISSVNGRGSTSNLKIASGGRDFAVTHGDLPVVSVNRAHLVSLLPNLISHGLTYHRPDVPPRIHVKATRQDQE